MKSANLLSILSLFISLLCLATLFYNHHTEEHRIEAATAQALKIREMKMVQNFKPNVESMLSGMGLKSAENYDPKTIEELLAPVMELVNAIDE